MPKLSLGLLAAAFIITGLVASAAQGSAQTSGAAPKAGTRLITVGTAGGPVPRAKRAQSSNLLIVNGTPYLIDAGDGVARRLAKLKFNLAHARHDLHHARPQRPYRRACRTCCRCNGARSAPSRSTSTDRPERRG